MADETIGPVWITKYAGGTDSCVRKVDHAERHGNRVWFQLGAGGDVANVGPPHWHTDRAAAVTQVKRVLADRIASLEKQLAAARAMDAEQIVPR